MFGGHFYHERIRKSVAVFGSLFNDLYVVRKSGGKVLGQMRVPIAYAPQRKFLERIADMNHAGDRDVENQVAVKLPRMSFEINNIQYDAQRQLPKSNYIKCKGSDCDGAPDGSAYKIYGGVPYLVGFELNVYGKQHDDCLQVVEQIVPFFNPQYTIHMKPLAGFSDIVEDVPLVLQSVSFSDNFEGSLEERRIIIYTLTFEMKVMFYGPTPNTPRKVIENIEVDFFDDTLTGIDSNAPLYLETLRVEAQQGEFPYHPVNQDSDYKVVKDVINLKHPYSGDPSYLSYEIPTFYLRAGESVNFHLGEEYNHFRSPHTKYTEYGDITGTVSMGDINIDSIGEVNAIANGNVPAINVHGYSLVNRLGDVIPTTMRFLTIPDSDEDDLIQLEGADMYGFIFSENTDFINNIDLYALEDSA